MKSGPLVALVGAVALIIPAPAAAGWSHAGGDPQATGRADGAGDFAGGETDSPGVAWAVSLPPGQFSTPRFGDVDGDGVMDLLGIVRRRVVALSGATGELLWSSGAYGLTGLVDVGELDGVSATTEVVATSNRMGGGVAVFDLSTGANRLWVTGLDQGSGVLVQELRLGDVDGDGALEAVWGLRLNGSAEIVALDMSTFDGKPRTTRVQLNGDYFGITHPTLGDFDGDGLANDVAIMEGTDLDRWSFCAPETSGAVCDSDEVFCLCSAGLVLDLYAQWSFPFEPEAVDVDGDGIDELILDHRHPSFPQEGFGVLEPWEEGVGGLGDPAISIPWFYRFGADSPPISGASTVGDFDLDGTFEVALTMHNDGSDEVGPFGDPADDGIDRPGEFTAGIWSAADGGLLASAPDRFLLGRLDLDRDGQEEFIAATTSGAGFTTTGITGLALECASPTDCALTTVWSTVDFGALRFPASHDVGRLPSVSVATAGEGVDLTLLAYDGADLVTLGADGSGGVQEVGRVTLADDDSVLASGPSGIAILVGSGASLWSSSLASSVALELPSAGSSSWLGAPLATGIDLPIFDDRLFTSSPPPSSLEDATAVLLEHPALVVDLDGDGNHEVVSWERDPVDGLFSAVAHAVSASGATSLWTFSAGDVAELGTQTPWSSWPFGHADYNDDGTDDIAVLLGASGEGSLIVLDGTDGSLLQRIEVPSRQERWAPLISEDLIDAAGQHIPDGTPDLLLPSLRQIGVYSGDGAGGSDEVTTSFWNDNALVADLDGDGGLDLLLYQSFVLAEPKMEAWSIDDGFSLLWGPVDVQGPPPDVQQSQAVGAIDAVPGLDPVYITADGALRIRSGADGAILSGFPLFLSGGEAGPLGPDPDESEAEAATAVIVADVDGDGNDDVLVGSRAGWLYAVDAGADPPGLHWAFLVGEEIASLGAADIDGDGALEWLVSSVDGVARALDSIGVAVEILVPEAGACLGTEVVTVSGTSRGVERVAIQVAGGDVSLAEVDGDGNWSGDVPFGLSPGSSEISAQGLVGDLAVVTALVTVESELDADADGTTTCGGDCDDDDPAVGPDAEEVCDGIDNDCDPATDESVDGDGDGVTLCDGDCDDTNSAAAPGQEEICDGGGGDEDCDGLVDEADDDCDEDPDPGADDDDSVDDDAAGGGCDCESSVGPAPVRGAWALAFGLLALSRRRRSA